MERLSPADVWFLHLEGPTMHLHVTGLLVLDPSTAPGAVSYATLRRRVEGRLNELPMLRRRVLEVPLGIDHAVWIDDPDFDLSRHVHHHRLIGAGSHSELLEVIGEFASIPLDRGRPLWEMVVIDGLDDGAIAVAIKMHHAMVDGVTGIEVLAQLLDLAPKATRRPPAPDWQPQRAPGKAEVMASATWNRLSTPLRPARAALNAGASAVNLASAAVRRRIDGAERLAHPLGAPRTALNGTLTSRRVVAIGQFPLDNLKTVGQVFDVTVNDVILAACTAGLRSYLDQTYDGIPERSLVCSVPVSTHGHSQRDDAANQVSDMFVYLPVHLADPFERLRSVQVGCRGAKELHESIGTDIIGDIVELLPATVFHLGARMFSESGLADVIAPVHNLIVSNVIGVPVPLYFGGAEVVGMYPFGPLMEGSGLNITVVSSNGLMNLGLIACPALVPDVDRLVDGIIAGADELFNLAAAADIGRAAAAAIP